jgi:hypothetical protein
MTQTLKKKASKDKITIFHNRSWQQFKAIQKGLDGCPGVRLSFYEGEVVIFMPGRAHEMFKKLISFLLEYYFLQHQI